MSIYVFLLSQENIELAEWELKKLLELKEYTIKGRLLFANVSNDCLNKIPRLAFTKKAFELLFKCNIKELRDAFMEFEWEKHYKTDFCLRINDFEKRFNLREAEFGSFIWKSLEKNKIKPKVNLKTAKTLIEAFIIKNNCYIAKSIWEHNEKFDDRKAHMMPKLHPTAMHPKMAKALVNLLNPKNNELIIDPFCGACGILTEAGLMNIRFIGYDIDQGMLKRAKTNLDFNKVNPKLYELKQQDVLKSDSKKMKNIITDVPYGQSSLMSQDRNTLYSEFIKKISGKAVIVMPDHVDYKKILKNNLNKKLKIEKIIDYYVHKSLTRKITIIS